MPLEMLEKNHKEVEEVTGADAVVKSLLAEGVDLMFGYPGGAIMPIYDALYHYEKELRHILTRHEQGAIHAAQGYARASGKVGVVFATSGPGATNLITGLADAKIDSTPLVCITGQVAFPLLGSDAFQETDIIGISTPVTKWNYLITDPEEIPEVLAKAFYIARTGRPGPVLVDITKDAQFKLFNFTYKKCVGLRSYHPTIKVNDDKVKEAAELINRAKKPLVLFGQGVVIGEAEEELKKFIEKTGIPAAWTIMGLSALPSGHSLGVGMLGMHGNYAPNLKTNECDVLIAVGMRFDDRVTGNLSKYAKQAKVIHLEIDPAEIDKNVKTTVAVLGSAKDSLRKLTALVDNNQHPEWVDSFRVLWEKEDETVVQKEFYPVSEGITMAEVIRRVNEETKGDAIVVTDVGQHQMITCRYARFNNSRSKITSGGLGTMGFCLPAAIGAKLAMPHKEVVAVIGDGGFQMTIQELGTINQFKIPVKILILNNQFLGMVRQWQQMFFDKRYSFVNMVNPDFITISKGYGIEARRVTKREELGAAIKEFINSKDSYLLEVEVEKEDNVFPMVPTGAAVDEIILENNHKK